jgi:hypothetical protein
MMKRLSRMILIVILSITVGVPKPAQAFSFGADVAVLTEILANTVQQLVQLRRILSTGSDTLGLMRDINRGIRDGLRALQMIHPRFNPGIYGNLETADQVLRIIDDLYGRIPQTAELRLQEAQDRSASESISMNGTLFKFADEVDEESKRIFAHSQNVSPQGAAKLTAQSLAILIGVTTQVLRSNSMILKNMGENMALQNRKEKLQSAQFREQYDGLSHGFDRLPSQPKLGTLRGN